MIAYSSGMRFAGFNGQSPCDHFVEDDAERPDIGACVDQVPARLLGTHVGRSVPRITPRITKRTGEIDQG